MSFSRRTLLKASAASGVLGGIGAPMVARGQQDLSVSFRSFNFRDRFIRHKNFLAELEPVSTELDRLDATFIFHHGGLAEIGDGFASWESRNFPDHYLRHQNFRLVLHKRPPPGSPDLALFRRDATFAIVPSLAAPTDRQFQSFRSVNFPTRMLRHRDFHLFLDEVNESDDLFRKDATFHTQDGFVRQS